MQERLTVYFQRLAGIPERQLLLFRQSNNGAYVLPPPAGILDEPVARSDFLQIWRVTPIGYPAVRKFLEDSRYFSDDF